MAEKRIVVTPVHKEEKGKQQNSMTLPTPPAEDKKQKKTEKPKKK